MSILSACWPTLTLLIVAGRSTPRLPLPCPASASPSRTTSGSKVVQQARARSCLQTSSPQQAPSPWSAYKPLQGWRSVAATVQSSPARATPRICCMARPATPGMLPVRRVARRAAQPLRWPPVWDTSPCVPMVVARHAAQRLTQALSASSPVPVSVFLQSVIFELSIGKKPPLPPMNWQILR